jgi:uncharacterized repeat protein (TIGR01451 family)
VLTLARPSPTASILSFYAAPTTGIYGVRFTAATSGGQTNNADIADPRILDANRVSAWDVTVRANVSSLTDLNARVFTYAWTVYLQANGRILNNALRYVSTDGFRYRQTFRGLDPNRATFYANAQGFIDAGAPLYRDVRGNDQTVAAGPSFSAGVTAQAPQYPIFFSDVAQGGPNAVEVNKVLTALAIPTAPLQPQLSNPQFVGNLSGNQSTVSAGGVFTFDTLNTLTYEIVISLDGVDFDPANVNNRVLTGTALSGSHSVLWDGLNNNAVPFPAGSYDFRIYGRNGEIHFPMLDVEGNANGGPTLEKLNGFQPADAFTVYYDDRGYRTANATVIGVLNGHLCGATSPIAQPTPTHSLVGVDSSVGGPSTYYRRWSGSSDTNVDCDNDANEYFATAKGLDLWALERSPVQVLPLVIVPLSSGIDVGTQAGATSSVLPGGTAFGSFSFTNAGDTTATGVNYSVTIGNPLDPATCPASVNFTLLPAGVTATYNPAPLCTVTFTGMPTSLTPGQTLNFNFNYVVAPTNPGPIPVNTSISAGNENCTINCAPNSASAQTMVATPVITIAKTANPVSGSNVNVGSLIEYTVAVTIGNAPLTAVLSLDDTLSAGLTFGSVISAHPSFDCSSAPDCTLPIGTAIGTYTVVYSATVTGSASPVSNNVAGSGGGDLDGPACTPAVGGCATQHNVNLPNLVISKTASVASAVVGDNFSYTLTVTNTGSAATTAAAVVTDTIPAGLTIGTLPAGCVLNPPASQTVECTIASGLAASGGQVSFVIPVTATATAVPSVTNTASVTGGGDPDCVAAGDCSHPPVNTPVGAPNLVISKTASVASAVVGDNFSYTLTVTNTGSAATTAAAVVTDTIPAGLTIGTLPAGCVLNPPASQTVECTIASGLAASGGQVSFVIPVTATATAVPSVTNTASVTGGGDPDCVAAGDCSHPPVNTPVGAPNLVISKTASVASAVVGDNFSYTLTVTNTGSAATTAAAVVTDTIPAGLTIGTLPAGCVLNPPASQTVECTIASGLAASGGQVSFVIPVTATATAVPSVTNTASVTGGGDPDCVAAGDCSHPPVNTPVGAPVLTLTKSAVLDNTVVAPNDQSNPGDTIAYTVTVVNSGNGPATNVVVTDPLVTLSCLPASGSTLAASATMTCTGTYTLVAGDVGNGSVSNTATVAGGNVCNPTTVGSTCSDTEVTPLGLVPVLTLTKSAVLDNTVVAPNDQSNPGDTIAYTVTVVNSGNGPATNVVVTDPLVTLSCLPASGSTLAASATMTCTGTYTLVAGDVGNGSVSNTATVAGGNVCNPTTVGSTCSDTEVTPLGLVPVLTLTKSAVLDNTVVAPNDQSNPGDTIAYTVTVVNSGNGPATNVVVTDPLVTLSCLPASGSTLAASATMTCTGTYTLVAGDVGNGSVSNTATVEGGNVCNPTTVGSTCSDTEVTPLGLVPVLTLTKSAVPNPFVVGQAASYSITVTNNGNAPTTANIVVTDTLPTGISLASANGTNWSCAGTTTLTCTFTGTLVVSGSTTLTLNVSVSASATNGDNTATASGGGDPTCPAAARCTDTVIVPVNAPNLSIVKAGPASATVGVAYNYTLTVDNTGTADATANATVTDTVPTGLTINSAGPGCTTVGQLVTCTIAAADLQVSDPAVVITINVTPTATATSPINNSATVTGGGDPDCTVGCGSNVVITTLGSPIADLAIVKTAPANSTVGQNVTFTIVVTNNGPNTATATMLTDPTPVGLQFVSNSGDCVTAFPCALGDLAVGASRTIQATFLIPVGYSGPSTIMNTATVTSSSTDPTPGDTSSSASTVVSLVPTFQPPAVIPVDARWALALLVGLMTLLAGWSLTRRG